jgi:hypothetical protein
MAAEVAVAAEVVEVEAAEAETVRNDSKQVVTTVKRQQQQQMDGHSSDLLEWRASREVHVGAIGDGGMSSRCCW